MNGEYIKAAIEDAIEVTRCLEEPFRSIAFKVVLERRLKGSDGASETAASPLVKTGETLAEFTAARQPATHVNRVMTFAYFSLHSGDSSGRTVKEIEDAYKQVRVKKPQNIPDVIGQCMRRGLLVEADRKDGAKAWVITARGEAYVGKGFEVP